MLIFIFVSESDQKTEEWVVFHWGIGVQTFFVDGIVHLSWGLSGLADLCVYVGLLS